MTPTTAFESGFATIAYLLAGMAAVAALETLIPLHRRGRWNRAHLGPNFALTAVTPLLRSAGLQVEIFNVIAGGLVIGVMLIPTIASLSEDAMAAVPQALRDGAYGLGADRLQVSTRVVVPAAISGIIASFVLGISRAVGETMIVLIAVGQLPQISFDPRQPMETMTAFIGATGNGDLPTGSIEYKTIFAVGLTLFVLTLVMNVISIRLVRKYREVYD